MTVLVRASSLSKSFGPMKVLTDATLQIDEGQRVGLVGNNGAGKSTLLRLILGEEKPDTGEIIRRTDKIGYMQQFTELPDDATPRDVLSSCYGFVETIKRRQAEIDDMMMQGGDVDWNALAEESAELERKLSSFESEIDDKLQDVFASINFPTSILDRKMDTLSGGERTKVMIAKLAVQISDCDLLIMDEPTSHLDITTIEWMQDMILSSKCAVLVVSHDRYFLDAIVTRVIEIENGKTREYKGNYSQFVEKKNEAIERAMAEFERYENQKKKQEAIAEQMFHDQRRYMASYKTRLMLIDKMEKKERPEDSKKISINFQAAQKSGKNVIIANGMSVDYDGRTILSGVDLDIEKGDKVGVFGANGAGKSTLIRSILGEIPVKGELWVAPGAKIGYYSQNHEGLDLNLTAEEQMLMIIGKDRKAEARNMLAHFLLTDENVTNKMSTLSGGQRAGVALCMLLNGATNLLILDEPTNYVDIESKHMLEQALSEYDGTVITITHDRYFLDNVCNKVIEVSGNTAKMYNGNYTDIKGKPVVKTPKQKGDSYRGLSPFTNWAQGKKYAKGDKVIITPDDMPGFETALNQGKLRKQ